jgi:hypothetical protein
MTQKTIFNNYLDQIDKFLGTLDEEIHPLTSINEGYFSKMLFYGRHIQGSLVFIVFSPDLKHSRPVFKIEIGWSRNGLFPSAHEYAVGILDTFVSNGKITKSLSIAVASLAHFIRPLDLFWGISVLEWGDAINQPTTAFAPHDPIDSPHPFSILRKFYGDILAVVPIARSL